MMKLLLSQILTLVLCFVISRVEHDDCLRKKMSYKMSIRGNIC